MDWKLAITLNREDLIRVVAALCAMVGLVLVGPMAKCLPRHLKWKVLLSLRPAEAATRRLAMILARDVVVPDRAKRAAPGAPIPRGSGARGTPAFPLFDPRKTFNQASRRRGPAPRIFFFDGTDPVIEEEIAAEPDDPLDAQRLLGRLRALRDALDDLPKQAQRMARALARRANDSKRRLMRPIRPGRPPGHRTRPILPVDGILAECHALALMPPDTS